MGQLPLTFGKVKGGPPGAAGPPKPPGPPAPLTVQGLLRELRGKLEGEFRLILVTGEVSNISIPRSGHLYFTLKEAQAQIRCVLWRDQQARLRFQLKDGLTVLVRAKVTVFDRGDLSLNVLHVEPVGEGALQQAFKDLAEKLKKEGLTDPAGKRSPVAFPKAIGVVTSRSGAALQDVLRTIWRRHPGQAVVLAPTEVQGQGAAQKVARAIAALDASSRVEVILVVRGGGSLEDLWAFNEEEVARAIVACRVPVITGIGHESDTTIADLVADLRASTPTGAAERAVAERQQALLRLRELRQRLRRGAQGAIQARARRLLLLERRLPDPRARLARHAQLLDALAQQAERRLRARLRTLSARLRKAETTLARRRPDRLLARRAEALRKLELRLHATLPPRLVESRERLAKAIAARDQRLRARLERGRHQLEKLVLGLEARSPLAVLARGYALVTDEQGKVVRRASELGADQRLQLRLQDGQRWVRTLPHEEER